VKNWTMAAILTVPLVAQTPGSGTVYPSGSTVSLAEFGVSFQVPQGWRLPRTNPAHSGWRARTGT
jgi:hypothetical protein